MFTSVYLCSYVSVCVCLSVHVCVFWRFEQQRPDSQHAVCRHPPLTTTILSQNTNSLITHWAGVKQINCRGGREAAADITDLTQRKLQRATLLKKYSNNHKDGTHYLSGSVTEDVCFYGFYNDVTGVLEH